MSIAASLDRYLTRNAAGARQMVSVPGYCCPIIAWCLWKAFSGAVIDRRG